MARHQRLQTATAERGGPVVGGCVV
jgi:hypothetical protein